jgi:peptidoglycan/xylan/chitin deacetylase (PgdA/CDA1 family)
MNPSEASLNPSQPFWKRALKCAISLFVFLADRTRKGLRRVVGQTPEGRCVVLYYHSVPAEERQLFAHQLDVVLACADPMRTDAAESIHRTSGRDSVAVTFDDGFENFLTQALPELEKRKIPATVFVIADGMNREFGSAAYAERLLSLEQVLSLPSLVTIGSHTVSHPLLTQLDESEARREIRESRMKLEAMLDRPVREFSFPFGGFNERLIEFCHEAGYERAYTTLPAFAFKERNEFAVGRVRVDPTDWPLEFRLKVAGAYRWLPAVFSLKRKIVSMATNPLARPAVRPSTPRSMVR